jgi:glycosyltransferase involved in cell wall biosynthesis
MSCRSRSGANPGRSCRRGRRAIGGGPCARLKRFRCDSRHCPTSLVGPPRSHTVDVATESQEYRTLFCRRKSDSTHNSRNEPTNIDYKYDRYSYRSPCRQILQNPAHLVSPRVGEKDHNFVFDFEPRFSFWFINHTSAKVIVNSKSVFSYFQRYDIPSTKLSLVSYSADVTLPQIPASLPSGFNVVMATTIAPGKGQHEAIEAVHILRSKGLNIQLTLVGGHNPAYSTHIRELVKKYDLCDAVHILGHSDRPLSYLSAADVVLVCSSNEAFGRVTVRGDEIVKASDWGICCRYTGTDTGWPHRTFL